MEHARGIYMMKGSEGEVNVREGNEGHGGNNFLSDKWDPYAARRLPILAAIRATAYMSRAKIEELAILGRIKIVVPLI